MNHGDWGICKIYRRSSFNSRQVAGGCLYGDLVGPGQTIGQFSFIVTCESSAVEKGHRKCYPFTGDTDGDILLAVS